MKDELRPDDPASVTQAGAMPLQREAYPPRRDRWLMPLIAAGCTLAGVAVGFVLGQRSAQPAAASAAIAAPSPDDEGPPGRHFFAFNWRDHDHRQFAMPPIPPMPPLGPRELVIDNCGDDDDDACTTIVKRKADGSMVIVKTRR